MGATFIGKSNHKLLLILVLPLLVVVRTAIYY